MKKLLLSFALLSINACIIGAAGSADVKREAEESSGAVDELFRQQAESWAKEALKGLTDLEQIVLINVAFNYYSGNKAFKRGYRMTGSELHRVKAFKNEKLNKLVDELQKEALSLVREKSENLLISLKYKFLALKKYSTAPDEYKVQIFKAAEFPED